MRLPTGLDVVYALLRATSSRLMQAGDHVATRPIRSLPSHFRGTLDDTPVRLRQIPAAFSYTRHLVVPGPRRPPTFSSGNTPSGQHRGSRLLDNQAHVSASRSAWKRSSIPSGGRNLVRVFGRSRPEMSNRHRSASRPTRASCLTRWFVPRLARPTGAPHCTVVRLTREPGEPAANVANTAICETRSAPGTSRQSFGPVGGWESGHELQHAVAGAAIHGGPTDAEASTSKNRFLNSPRS